MKLITAVIKPSKLDDVRQALSSLGVQGMTVTEVARNLGIRTSMLYTWRKTLRADGHLIDRHAKSNH